MQIVFLQNDTSSLTFTFGFAYDLDLCNII